MSRSAATSGAPSTVPLVRAVIRDDSNCKLIAFIVSTCTEIFRLLIGSGARILDDLGPLDELRLHERTKLRRSARSRFDSLTVELFLHARAVERARDFRAQRGKNAVGCARRGHDPPPRSGTETG